jgi:hypothetical protein
MMRVMDVCLVVATPFIEVRLSHLVCLNIIQDPLFLKLGLILFSLFHSVIE